MNVVGIDSFGTCGMSMQVHHSTHVHVHNWRGMAWLPATSTWWGYTQLRSQFDPLWLGSHHFQVTNGAYTRPPPPRFRV